MGEKVGKTDSEAVEASERANPGNMYQDSYKDHLTALSLRGKTTIARYAPFEAKRDAVSSCNLVGYSCLLRLGDKTTSGGPDNT